MAKKKQFAGKKTKLARLSLTQALTSQAEGGASLSPAPSPSISLFNQVPRTWDEVRAGRGGPLVAAFLSLVRDLADLQGELLSSPGPPAFNHRAFLPKRVPPHPRIMAALRQARQSLQDLKSRLSHL
jgi:hypothetical protein